MKPAVNRDKTRPRPPGAGFFLFLREMNRVFHRKKMKKFASFGTLEVIFLSFSQSAIYGQ
ncbi:hypothetical protein DMH27_17465 [Raoultella planticola]|nr:hypothetical protein [Raoultella planticola]